ncbi:rh106.1 [macacine betaherpesvirus 3]|uniref:Rh106.1 n=1 Tax=Rhesus cytomegalovirus (strain 68-1) TaxID=47929 RepID=Q2FAK7_RHCM6|nr:rh106.1 [macacine betaherpesvirus 3]
MKPDKGVVFGDSKKENLFFLIRALRHPGCGLTAVRTRDLLRRRFRPTARTINLLCDGCRGGDVLTRRRIDFALLFEQRLRLGHATFQVFAVRLDSLVEIAELFAQVTLSYLVGHHFLLAQPRDGVVH